MSLTELMLSLFIAGMISTILIQTYVLNKAQFKRLHQALEFEFDIQWIQDLLAQSIRSAGFTPCLSVDYLTITDTRSKPKAISSITFNETNQSLHVSKMSEYFTKVNKRRNELQVIISSDLGLTKDQPIMIADCTHAEIHDLAQVRKTAQGGLLTLKQPLQTQFNSETYIGLWIEEKWFIKNNAKGEGAFYFHQNHSEELSSSIYRFQGIIQRVKDKKLVQLILFDKKNKVYKFNTAVRA